MDLASDGYYFEPCSSTSVLPNVSHVSLTIPPDCVDITALFWSRPTFETREYSPSELAPTLANSYRPFNADDLQEHLERTFGPAVEAARVAHQEIISKTNPHIPAMQNMLAQLGTSCGLCLTNDPFGDDHHDPFHCPRVSPLSVDLYRDVKNLIGASSIPPGHIHFRCGIPNPAGKNSLHGDWGGQPDCNNPWLVIPIAQHVARTPELRDAAHHDFGKVVMQPPDLYSFPEDSTWPQRKEIQKQAQAKLAKSLIQLTHDKFVIVMFKVTTWWYWTQYHDRDWKEFP